MDIDHVNKSIAENYRELRTRIGVVALAFPVVLILVGLFWGISVQPTLSDYYFAKDPVGGRVDLYPVRLWFCGVLFFVGMFLFRYKGFSKNEDRWLGLAGFFAICVAVFPMTSGGKSDFNFFASWGLPQLSLHGISAVLAFVCIGVVIFWFADSTLSELKEAKPSAYKRYKAAYFFIGAFMAVSIAISVVLHYLNRKQGSYILMAEAAGIWAFAAYWFVKNSELTLLAEVLKKGEAKTKARPAKVDAAEAL